mmetsp:Transcript_532/g.1042  ORF Transcript_532/g.1042 Transcript_532/m.1042 type:complete len:104 (-) Transcript_532:61-372(-)
MIIVSSAGFLYRNTSLWNSKMKEQTPWWCASIVVILLQLVFTFSISPEAFSGLSSWHFLLFLLPFIVVAVDEIVKAHDSRLYQRFQKRERLMFDTLLGMHSPK